METGALRTQLVKALREAEALFTATRAEPMRTVMVKLNSALSHVDRFDGLPASTEPAGSPDAGEPVQSYDTTA